MKPKKLIRNLITEKLKEGEWETITDQEELNRLYAIKLREELAEIQDSGHKDIMEFVDLIDVAISFANENGFTNEQLKIAITEKSVAKGCFGRLALNNLNPDNPSNKLYFENNLEPENNVNIREKLIKHYEALLTKDYKYKMGDDDYAPSTSELALSRALTVILNDLRKTVEPLKAQ